VLPIAYRAARIVFIRVTAPAGLRTLTGYDVVIRATSSITPKATNETIDRLYAGFVRLDKSTTVINPTTNSTATASGQEVEFTIKYSNISTTVGVGSALLTASNFVIFEDGKGADSNWWRTSQHVVGASDSYGGYIIGDREGSYVLTDIIPSLEAGRSGVFKFKRRIK